MWLLTFSPTYRHPATYLDWVARRGIEGVVHRTDDPDVPDPARFKALLLTGGGDVAPAAYGARAEPETGGVDPSRDARERELIAHFLLAGKPVFGICRGIQVLNVHFGGRLVQHVPRWLAARGGDGEVHGGAAGDVRHALVVEASTGMGAGLLGVAEANSMHHQALDPDGVAPCLRVTARSGRGVIEACEGVGCRAPVEAVQWHPERLPASDPASQRLLDRWVARSLPPVSRVPGRAGGCGGERAG